jgi:hypothetical protein
MGIFRLSLRGGSIHCEPVAGHAEKVMTNDEIRMTKFELESRTRPECGRADNQPMQWTSRDATM